jgi:DNA-binding PadR family transcriptional regulator
LADEERHGYAIAQQVEAATNGALRMGPGTLYGSLQRMLASGLVAPVARHPRAAEGEVTKRRHYYKISPLGRRVLTVELQRLDQVVALARSKQLLRRGPASA